MKLFLTTATALAAAASVASSFSIQSSRYSHGAISRREADPEPLSVPLNERFDEEFLSYLEKRRGGGGSSGGGGHSSSSGSSSSSSGSSGSSSGSSGGAKSGSSGSSSTGGSRGSTSSSSSISPSYGGGRYYAGGATSSYRSGGRSPSGILPFALAGAALGIFPGLWLYGAYEYPYNHDYSFHNSSNSSQPQGQNETLPVTCLCQMYSACGCDNNSNTTYLDSLVGNGSAADENSTLIHVGDVNGTKTLIINGTLPNGTNGSTSSTSSVAGRQSLLEYSGFWLVGAIVGATVWLL